MAMVTTPWANTKYGSSHFALRFRKRIEKSKNRATDRVSGGMPFSSDTCGQCKAVMIML
jgi:hypothetical protein